ncbi:MAG: Eco57I restriction-modification methylase domain-containing protein [Chthoniobacterales bacterium]
MTPRIAEAVRRWGGDAGGALLQDFFPGILVGGDPLGAFFAKSFSPQERRATGATFTPSWLVELQLDRIAAKCIPARVVDAGAGTGRYAMSAARRWPQATIIAVEKNPTLAEALRINARAAGLSVQVVCADYLSFDLPPIVGTTAFVGNPPYVRHHGLSAKEKAWYSQQMTQLRLPHSQLAGLHVYFHLKSYLLSRPGDVGCFVTAAEWMETNYGESMRQLFCLMGGDGLIRANPAEQIFADALTTSAIVEWSTGFEGNVHISDLDGRDTREQFQASKSQLSALSKWPGYGRRLSAPSASGPILGDYFQISRGQVTGCNEIWVATEETARLIPDRYLFPCVTHASEVIDAQGILRNPTRLRRVIDLPADLNELSVQERRKVDSFLEVAEKAGAANSYIARHRKPWRRVGLKTPPPIVMSYMARRPPKFARNACGARLLNIAHGLTPLRPLDLPFQNRLVAWLNENVCPTGGRTYAGGMVKFEPGDAMRIPLPAELGPSIAA